jgi:hypothetical protein
MGSHAGQPLPLHLGRRDARAHVHGKAGEASRAETTLDMIDLRCHGVESALGMRRNRATKSALSVEPSFARLRIPCKNEPVAADHRVLEARGTHETRIESGKASGQDRDLDDTLERTVGIVARPTDRKKRLTSELRFMMTADVEAIVVVLRSLKIFLAGVIPRFRRGVDGGRDQSMSRSIKHPDRLHFRKF